MSLKLALQSHSTSSSSQCTVRSLPFRLCSASESATSFFLNSLTPRRRDTDHLPTSIRLLPAMDFHCWASRWWCKSPSAHTPQRIDGRVQESGYRRKATARSPQHEACRTGPTWTNTRHTILRVLVAGVALESHEELCWKRPEPTRMRNQVNNAESCLELKPRCIFKPNAQSHDQ